MTGDRLIEAIPSDPELIRSRREQIITAALRVFIEKGYHHATTRDIARAGGFAVGTIYQYFGTKEDILYLACQQQMAEFEERLRVAVTQHHNALDKFRAAVYEYFRMMAENRNIQLLYRESQSLGEEARNEIMHREDDIIGIFVQIVQEGVDQGIFKRESASLVAYDIVLLSHVWWAKRWPVHKRFGLNEFIQAQIDILLSGICKQAEPPVPVHADRSTDGPTDKSIW